MYDSRLYVIRWLLARFYRVSRARSQGADSIKGAVIDIEGAASEKWGGEGEKDPSRRAREREVTLGAPHQAPAPAHQREPRSQMRF